jgi:hypothetical protein
MVGNAIVTKIYRCTTFARLLTNGHPDQICVGFSATAPLSVPVPAQLGAGLENVWKVYSQVGWSPGNYDPAVYQYSPLAKLRQARPENMSSGWRGPPPTPITDPDRQGMMAYYPLWGEINEKGRDIDDENKTVQDEEL